MGLGQYAQAVEAFERARAEATRLGVAPDASTLLYTAQALFELGRSEEALEMAERGRTLLDEASDPTPAWYLAGRCLFALKRYREALAAFEQALARHPEVWAVRVRVIRTQWGLGRYRAPVATLLSAARQRPDIGTT
jgi:tetratricopeptide (TPR) repeat protein